MGRGDGRGDDRSRPVRRVVVVGAGVVGLSVAWHLSRQGVDVVVLERDDVAAGSSWGNAGWLSPGLVAPLPDPAVRRYALRALVDPSCAISVPLTFDVRRWDFLADFARRCTAAAWHRALPGLVALGLEALDAHDELGDAGIAARTVAAPIVTAFARGSDAGRLRHELELLATAGQPLTWRELDGDEARTLAPQLSARIGAAIRVDGQRYVDPGAYVCALADAVRAGGAEIRTGTDVAAVHPDGDGVRVTTSAGEPLSADAAVVATGAWLDRLLPPGATAVPVHAGRGYSFTVDTDPAPACPVYLPHARVACTPYAGAMRVGGGMELSAADAPGNPRRIRAVEADARPYLRGVDWASRRDDWVGARPVTADGLPVVGRTGAPGIFVAGGHGMWGMTLGPVTGRLLAAAVAGGAVPAALAPLDPLRRLRPVRRGRRARPGAGLP
ncbi:MAG TPA: FAD-dependent oxidoreductase [Acidimicrobiales bacterium]|nr:FAD-dependent oxidoreductase [Acidimicrobiales bacterium]